MNTEIKESLKLSVADFKLPRYESLPDMGLYLEQVTKYINGLLEPIYCAEITTSMVSNYVKKGFIKPPHKKQYDVDQIVYLIFITITKNVLSLEDIVSIFDMQKATYTLPMAYNYFCSEFENRLEYVFGLKDEVCEDIGITDTDEKDFLKNIIISVSHSLYTSACFSEIKKKHLYKEQ